MLPLNISEADTTDASRKRSRHILNEAGVDNLTEQEEVNNLDGQKDPILYWTRTGHWPDGYSMPTNRKMSHLLARSSPPGFHSQTQSYFFDTCSEVIGSDENPREEKSLPYQDPCYKHSLETKGSFMEKSVLDVTENSKKIYRNLLEAKQSIPENTLFRDEVFEKLCKNIEDRNEARVIRDISPLIVPSAENLAFYGSVHLKILIEGINQGWNNSIPLTKPRPQPDFSVGFRWRAFTKVQLKKLTPFIGVHFFNDKSYFTATSDMFFPFLCCEVNCGPAGLEIADRQNAHSMTLAVRAVAELFRLVGRETEIHREILAFSFSHSHTSVRIYGHYPVIDGKDTKYYRHPVSMFDFTAQNGREKWTAYQFAKNIYDLWVPNHFRWLCSAIDQIPDNIDFSVTQLSQSTGLTQDLSDDPSANSIPEARA